MSSELPVTPLGWATGFGAVLAFTVAWLLGWVEFAVLGLGCLLALIAALPFIIGSHSLQLRRDVVPARVPVGDPARSVLEVTNTGRGRSSAREIADLVGGIERTIDIPPLGPTEAMKHAELLPTNKRGVIEVGPASVAKVDPLGLLRREFGRSEVEQLWVHPAYAPLSAIESGFMKDLEGPTYDTSPAGDVAFHALREYTPGDDVRQIHWMSTARTGQLVVKHNVDNRRPFLGVLVDNQTTSMSAEQFEVALEAAASIAMTAIVDRRPVAIWVGEQTIVSNSAPADRNEMLTRFCVSEQVETLDLPRQYEALRLVDPEVSALVLLTGPKDGTTLLPLATEAARHGGIIVGRAVDPGQPPTSLPNAHLFDYSDLDRFVAQWGALVR